MKDRIARELIGNLAREAGCAIENNVEFNLPELVTGSTSVRANVNAHAIRINKMEERERVSDAISKSLQDIVREQSERLDAQSTEIFNLTSSLKTVLREVADLSNHVSVLNTRLGDLEGHNVDHAESLRSLSRQVVELKDSMKPECPTCHQKLQEGIRLGDIEKVSRGVQESHFGQRRKTR